MATLELPYEKVYDLLHKCCTSISPDVLYLMKRAAAKETNPEAKTFLETMLKNVMSAAQKALRISLKSLTVPLRSLKIYGARQA